MSNPWLSTFAAPYVHPSMHDINDPDDPDYEDVDDADAWGEFTRGHDFGRWRTPGASIKVPIKQGPVFAPGQTPQDVIDAEIVTPRDEAAADGIIHGDHESDQASENPDVERARQDLHTPAAGNAVDTLSGLLKGGSPQDVGGLDEAHDYLSRHFTGVRVNPHHGTVFAQSPAGTQIVKRQQHFPVIPQPNMVVPATYTLTNKHGDFQSDDPQRIIRSMIAFQIVHNAIAAEQKKKDDDQDSGLASTSGIRDVFRGIGNGLGNLVDSFRDPNPAPKPRTDVPPGAVWEAGRGTDVHNGQRGGWVARSVDAPADWLHASGTAYSPGHAMRLMLDPAQAMTPRPDPRFSGHTFTYAPNPETGHTEPRRLGHVNYWVQPDIHPAARGAGFDTIPASSVPPPGPGRMPRGGPRRPPHGSRPSGGGRITSAVQANDLCPVCASGYLEPYDSEFHECLNCGSLVKHVGFEKHAARPKGGLGRGLGQIIDPGASAAGMGLNDDGSAKADDAVDLDDTQAHHPLFGAPPLSEDQQDDVYEAPTELREKGQVRRTEASAPDQTDEIDEFMGKQGFKPIHKPGQERLYLAHMPGTEGGYLRLTEGVGGHGWVLSADHVPPVAEWRDSNQNRVRNMKLPADSDPMVLRPARDLPPQRLMLPDQSNRTMAEKSILAHGTHPIEDDALNRAIRDVAEHGRNSHTYQRVLDTAYEPPVMPIPGPGKTQRQLRGLSSVSNPGLTRFVS